MKLSKDGTASLSGGEVPDKAVDGDYGQIYSVNDVGAKCACADSSSGGSSPRLFTLMFLLKVWKFTIGPNVAEKD